MNKNCIVLFPVYKSLDEDEIEVVRQAEKMTSGFDKCFVIPDSLVLDDSFSSFKGIVPERFDDRFFQGIQGYNSLMLNIDFYKRFKDYKYILIHQTDAYLFKPELQYWCDKDYDYIGAPWYLERKLPKYNLYSFLFKYGKPFFRRETLLRWKLFNNVGNGGLSLRKVSSFIYVLEHVQKKLMDMYLSNESNFFHEDIFWSLEASGIKKDFTIPAWNEAIGFSVESYPEFSYKFLGNSLPFGCHAFRKGEPEFWKEFIPFLDVNQ